MELSDVRERVAALLADGGGDPEVFHGEEDSLMVSVLRAVASGHPDSAAMAAEVLRTADREDVTRWYA